MNRIAVFARPPVAGQVKPRLSPALPAAMAARLYEALLADTLQAAREASADERVIAWADAGGVVPPAEGFVVRMQASGDLGERLRRVFDALLRDPGDRAVVVGSDCPSLTGELLERAFHALERHDAVLGPSSDGGYWLLGLARPAPQLFRDIAWSTPEVFAQTMARAAAAGLDVALLPALADLDTPADLARLVAAFASGDAGGCGSRSTRVLREFGLLR